MDFGALPPEINSGRMYVGPGSGPMLTAAAAWDGLATDLYSTAASYGAVVAALTTDLWTGPSSASMAVAGAAFEAWLTRTAGQAEQVATQARSAADAYQTAFAMTVPPAAITANRSLLAALVANNYFGQNTPAIAAAQAQYAQMWAQDVVAMYTYAGSSASASRLTPFAPPAPTTNAAQAVMTGISVAPPLLSELRQALQSLASPMSSASSLLDLLGGLTPYAGLAAGGTGAVSAFIGSVGTVLGIVGTAAQASVVASGSADSAGLAETGSVASAAGALAGPVEPAAGVSVSLGKAAAVGALSVPPSWTTSTPMAQLVATPGIELGAEPIWTDGPAALWSALPMAQLNGAADRFRTYHYVTRPGTVTRGER